jgi:hypothetical protein
MRSCALNRLIAALEPGDLEKVVLTQRNRMRAVVVSRVAGAVLGVGAAGGRRTVGRPTVASRPGDGWRLARRPRPSPAEGAGRGHVRRGTGGIAYLTGSSLSATELMQ